MRKDVPVGKGSRLVPFPWAGGSAAEQSRKLAHSCTTWLPTDLVLLEVESLSLVPSPPPSFFFFFLILFYFYLFTYLFILGCTGSSVLARAFSSCGKWGPLFIAVRGPLIIAAPPVAGHRLQTRRLSNCGSRAQPLHGMWDPPRPGLEPVSPALAGRLSTTAPPGKPPTTLFIIL